MAVFASAVSDLVRHTILDMVHAMGTPNTGYGKNGVIYSGLIDLYTCVCKYIMYVQSYCLTHRPDTLEDK